MNRPAAKMPWWLVCFRTYGAAPPGAQGALLPDISSVRSRTGSSFFQFGGPSAIRGHFLPGKYSQGESTIATRGLTFRVPVGDRSKGTPVSGVDVVDLLGAPRAGTARGYLIPGPGRIRRREPVGDRPGRRSAWQQRGCPVLYAMYFISLI